MDAAHLAVRVTADTSQASSELNKFGKSMESRAKSLGAMSLGMTAAFTAPIVGAAAAAFKIGADFESAFTGVIKTFSGTTAEVAALRQGILDMANELPATAVEISAVAEAAGALGIEKENILGFTRTIIDMAEATDLTAEQAANDMARIANIMEMPQDQFDRMGSTIVALGNAGASTESEIVGMAMRIAGAGSVIGLSEAQVLGWASAMSSVGINAEAGGTAFSRVVVDMAKEVATGGKKLTKFAKVAGVSASDFAEAFEKDASAATLMFIEGLGGIAEAGGNVFGVLEELGLSDVRVQDTLLRLSGNTNLVTDSLDTANQAWEENIALAREAELRYGTTQSKIAMLQNRLKGLGITLFDTFKPAIEGALDGLLGFVGGIGDAIAGFAAANPALMNAALAFGAVLAAAGPLIGVAAAVAFALSALGTAAAPILLVVGAVAALAAGIAYLDSIGVIDLGAMWTTAKEKIDAAITSVKAWITQIQTQGLLSQETMLASFELPGNWGDILRFTIGMGAALKTLSGAVTGDLGVAEINELNLVLEGAFGETVATRINNIASHILTLKDALADASTVGEWFTGVSTFATNVGTEIQGIVDEADKQIAAAVQAAIDTIDVNLTIGATNIAWSPDLKSLDIPGVFTAQVTPKWVKVGVGTLTVRATPEWVNIERGEKNILQVQATPDWVKATVGEGAKALIVRATPEWVNIESGEKNVLQLQVTPEVIAFKIGEGVSLMVTPEITSFEGGPFSVEVTPKLTSIKAGELTVDVTPKINELLINGKTIPNLNWKEVIGITIDWATIVPALVWNTIVKPLEWSAILGTFSWFAFIKPMTPADWSKQVGDVDLADPSKTPALNWENFVTGVMLNTVAPVLDWHNFVIGTALSSFVEKLTWGEFIEGTLNWPSPKEILDAIVAAARGLAAPDFSKGRFDTEWPEQILSLDRRSGGGGRSGFGGAPVEVPGVIVLQRITEQDVEGALETKTVTIAPKISWGADSSQSVAGLAKMYEDALRSSASSISFDDIFGGVSGMASQITSALRTSVKDIGGDLFRDMQPGGVDQMANVKVKAEITDATAAANLKPLPMKAIIDEATLSAQTTALSTALQAPDISFSWPPLPEWEWPALPRFVWPALPQWRWPPIDRPAWLDSLRVPRPDWLGQLLSWSPELVIRQQSTTTPGQVQGEPQSRIAAKQSAVSAGAGGINITINANISNDLDLEELGQKLARIIDRRGRGLG